MLVTASQEAGVLEEQEEQMLHRVFGFADLSAGQVMLPRTELAAIAADTPRDEMVEQIARSGHSRLPVYRDDLDHIVGILHATDVLKAAFVVAAVSGFATLWMAVLADTGASIVVIANALRLLRAD